MSAIKDDLLIIGKKQQNQIDELIKHNGKLTSELGVNKPAIIPRNCDCERKDRRENLENVDTPKDDSHGKYPQGRRQSAAYVGTNMTQKNVGSWARTKETVQPGGRAFLIGCDGVTNNMQRRMEAGQNKI